MSRHFGKLNNTNDEESSYQTIEETDRKQPVQPPESRDSNHAEAELSLSILKSNDFTSSTTPKDYYLSPVSLNSLKEQREVTK